MRYSYTAIVIMFMAALIYTLWFLMIDFYTASVIVFIAVLAVYVYRDRRKFKRESGVLLLRRTERGKVFLARLGTRWPRVWKIIGMAGVASGFYFSAFIFWILLQLTWRNLTAERAIQGLSFVLPSPGAAAASVPGVFLVPFWYWIISIALLVVVHEGMHGILTAREGVRIKSLGTGLLAVIPLAFVEPDEVQLQKKGFWAQQRVFAAGSFANFVVAVAALGLLAAAATAGPGLYKMEGVQFAQLAEGGPAGAVNLSGTITSIGGVAVGNVSDLTVALEKVGAGVLTTVETTNGTFALTTGRQPAVNFSPGLEQAILLALGLPEAAEGLGGPTQSWGGVQQRISFWEYAGSDPRYAVQAKFRIGELQVRQLGYREPGYLGILGAVNVLAVREGAESAASAYEFVGGLLFFLFLINFGVGAFNLLPLKPLDGGRMWELVFRKLSSTYSKEITYLVGMLTLAIVVLNFVLPAL